MGGRVAGTASGTQASGWLLGTPGGGAMGSATRLKADGTQVRGGGPGALAGGGVLSPSAPRL